MYGRTLDGQELTFAATGWTWHDTFVLWDQETESIWFGGAGEQGWNRLVCVGGPLQDARLDRVPLQQRALWRSWYSGYPETKIMKRKGP